jgi:tRNA nucleotidyltransferase/poly(A) polymerase
MRFDEFYFQEAKLEGWDKIKTSNPEIRNAIEILDKINAAGFEALMVGGVVRDLVLGNSPNDVDITTNATPDQIEKIFGRTIDIGKNKAMGVTVIPFKGENYEIATYRKDMYTGGEGGKGADKVELTTSFKDDASRRDFTINQLGIDKDGNIIDHHGGLDHIEKKVIAAVGDPNLRFKEDEVRVLRGIRFASRLGFDIDKETLEAMKSHAPEIKKVAQERILKELTKMAEQSGDRFANAIIMLKDIGMLKHILPEIDVMDKYEHSAEHHPEGNVFKHTIAALKSYKGKDPAVNFGILFHDIGKPESYKNDEGKHTYHGHAGMSRRTLESLASRLHMDNDLRDAVIFAAENHMKFHDIQKMSTSTVAQMMQSPYWNILVQVAEADAKARGEKFDPEDWEKTIGKTKDIESKFAGKKAIESIKKVVNGKWVMQLRGINGGPEVGRVINQTVQWILDNEIDVNDKEKIENYIKSL